MSVLGRGGLSLARDQSHRKAGVSVVLALGLSGVLAGCGGSAVPTAQRSAHLAPLLSSSTAVVAREGGAPPNALTSAASATSVGTPQSTTKHAPPLALAGNVVTVDPGHNGGNFTHPQEIARPVYDGNGYKECDTTGTAAPDGYRETDFNWSVALDLRALLATGGAHVVMTRHSNDGVGPCVNERAAIGNRAQATPRSRSSRRRPARWLRLRDLVPPRSQAAATTRSSRPRGGSPPTSARRSSTSACILRPTTA